MASGVCAGRPKSIIIIFLKRAIPPTPQREKYGGYRCPSFWGGGREGEGGSERKCKKEERKGVNEEEIYTKNLLVYIYR